MSFFLRQQAHIPPPKRSSGAFEILSLSLPLFLSLSFFGGASAPRPRKPCSGSGPICLLTREREGAQTHQRGVASSFGFGQIAPNTAPARLSGSSVWCELLEQGARFAFLAQGTFPLRVLAPIAAAGAAFHRDTLLAVSRKRLSRQWRDARRKRVCLCAFARACVRLSVRASVTVAQCGKKRT